MQDIARLAACKCVENHCHRDLPSSVLNKELALFGSQLLRRHKPHDASQSPCSTTRLWLTRP